MGNVIIGEGAAFAVFEPFFADLVAADVEVPDLRRDAFKVLVFIDIDPSVRLFNSTFSTRFEPATGYSVIGLFSTGDSIRWRATSSAPFSAND